MVALAEAFIKVSPDSKRFNADLKQQVVRQSGREGIAAKVSPKVDQRQLADEGKKSGGRFATFFSQSLGGGLRGTVGMFGGIGVALAGVGAGFFKVTNLASDLNETISKAGVIFGDNSGEIQRWASGSVRSMGLTRNEAIGNATAFGDMFTQLGITGKGAVNMSERLVQLAADQASFSNADITQVLEAQQGAFRGEYDALQRFIPNINAARVQQEALRLTHKKSAADLTASEKAQATYNIMLTDSVRAQGDFQRTISGAANQQRIFKAGVTELGTQLGQVLLPVLNGVIGAGNAFLPVLGGVVRIFGELPAGVKTGALALGAFLLAAKALGAAKGPVGDLSNSIKDLIAKGGGVNAEAGRMGKAVGGFTAALKGAALSINPVSLGLTAAAAIVGYYAQKKAEAKKQVQDFTEAMKADGNAIGDNTRQVVAQRLETEGALKAAQQFGISLRDLTDATLGDADARARVNRVLDQYAAATQEATSSGAEANATTHESDQAYTKLRDTLDGTNKQVQDAAAASNRVAQAAPPATKTIKDQGTAAHDTENKVKGLNSALNDYINNNADAAQSSIDFKSKLASLTDTVHTNGRSLSENTQKGRDNRSAIIDLITAAQRHADAVARQTNNEKKGTAAFQASIPQIVAQAGKLGLNKKQVQALVDSIARLKPKTVPVTANVAARNVTVDSGRINFNGGVAHGGVTAQAYGGRVPGNLDGDRSDSHLVAATPGEFMIQRPTVRKLERWAPGFLDALNAGKIGLGGDPDTTEFTRGMKRFGYASGGLIQAVQSKLRSTDPLPYIWGGGGPGGYDCSGLVGAAYGALTGKGGFHGQRYFTTDSIGSAQGFRQGLGTFSVGVTPGRGHMAGNLGGLKFEARSTASGIHIGPSAMDVRSFARHFYLPQIGGSFTDVPFNGLTGKQLRQVTDAILPFVSRQLTASILSYDDGGFLPPGANNNTTKPEPVFTDDQWGTLKQLVAAGSGPIMISIDGRVLDERVDYRVERANAHTAWQASRGRRT